MYVYQLSNDSGRTPSTLVEADSIVKGRGLIEKNEGGLLGFFLCIFLCC
jgi:hypothetical protein